MNQSKFFSLGIRDILRGLLIAVLTPVFVIVQQSLESGSLEFNWKSIGIAAVAGGLAYITKNLFTKPDSVTQNIGGGGIKNPKPN